MRPSYVEVENDLKAIAERLPYKTVGQTGGNSPFSGSNFMTNHVVRRGQFANKVWFELSYGENIARDGWIYGVTLRGDQKALEDIQGCCFDMEEVRSKMAEAYKVVKN